jgi:hypothetical protein
MSKGIHSSLASQRIPAVLALEIEADRKTRFAKEPAAIERPGQPFLNWLQRVDPTSAHLTPGDLRRQPTIYLLPECDSEEQALEFLREISREIFEEQRDLLRHRIRTGKD